MENYLALQINRRDNVATVFADGVVPGTVIEVRSPKGDCEKIPASSPIPYGHKIAVRTIKKGEEIIKYGEEIGVASADIQKGEHVHVHNMDSMRGRGDLA